MSLHILLIDSNQSHRDRLRSELQEAGYDVDAIAHESAVGHISAVDMSRFAAVVVMVTDEPSSLAASHQMGEYVLHFITQFCPEVFSRVVAVIAPAALAGRLASRCRVAQEPLAPGQLAEAVASLRAED